MGGFNQQTVNDYGGVAWAKQVAESMAPEAIEDQLQGYNSAVTTLGKVQTTLQNIKNNLAASWSGDAADQAQTSFQASVNHAQLVQDTITQSVIPALQSAQSAQQHYMTTMSKVPDEQTVPSNSWVNDVESFFGSQTPAQKAEAHNTTVRTQAADALNTLSDSYDSSASKLNVVGQSSLETITPSNTGAYNLGSVSSSSGDGAASTYGESVHGGGSTAKASYVPSGSTGSINSVSDPRTALAGNSKTSMPTPTPDPIWTTTPSSKNTGTPGPGSVLVDDPDPIENNTANDTYNKSGLITDEPDEGAGGGLSDGLSDENLGRGGGGSSSGVFDETGSGDGELTGGTGSGLRGGTSSGDGSSLVSESDGAASGAVGGETSETSMGGGGMGRGMGGMDSGDEDLGSSRYSRGRFFDEEDEGSGLSPVRSAYEGATDADGNKVNMMAPGRRGAQDDDEEDERQKRPSHLKEDEFWKNAQRIVPPVIQ